MVDQFAPSRLARAAQALLEQSLDLRPGQNLLIFVDPEALPLAEVLTQAAGARGIRVTALYTPRAVQERFDASASLPLPVEAAIREANAIVSCLSDRAEHMAYRARVLRDSWRRRVRVAHVPGMTLDILGVMDTDFDLIGQRCHDLALALVMGKELVIETCDSQGRPHRLQVELMGWDLPPGVSDGRIPDGSWANLPPGETFIVPIEADGQVVINGSVPGQVIRPGQEIVLDFRDGRLRSVQPKNSPAAKHLHASQFAYAQAQGDDNWRNLAEIGFGVNPAIRHLTGVELVDEKKAGTVHVALGSSAFLGGMVESVIHCDLVIEGPTITIDGRPILERGAWRLRPESWLLDYRDVQLPGGWWESIRSLRRSGSRCRRDNGQLLREWSSRSGRHILLPVGRGRSSQLAARLMDILQELGGQQMPRADFVARARQVGLVEKDLPALVWILERYDLVRIQRE